MSRQLTSLTDLSKNAALVARNPQIFGNSAKTGSEEIEAAKGKRNANYEYQSIHQR